MALTFDGASTTASQPASGGTTGTSTSITMAHANDLVVCVIACENTGSPHRTVTSVTKSSGTATVGTFTKRASVYNDNAAGSGGGNYWGTLEVWSATTTVAGTLVLSVVVSGAVDTSCLSVFAVNFDSVSVPIWSANASLPKTATLNTGSSAPTVSGVTTNGASIVLGFCSQGDIQPNTASAGYSITFSGTSMSVNSPAGGLGTDLCCEQQSFAAAQSGITVAFGTSWQTWSIIADAIEAPAAAAVSGIAPIGDYLFAPGRGPMRGLRPAQAFPSQAAALALSAAGGTYNFSGSTVTPAVGMPAAGGSYTFTGSSATPGAGIPLAGGSYSYGGTAVTLAVGLPISGGSYTFTGTAALVGPGLVPAGGAYVFTGTAAALASSRHLALAGGSYTFTGTAVSALAVGMPAAGGTYAFTGTGVTPGVGITITGGAYTFSGTAATLTKVSGGSLAAGSGSYLFTGTGVTPAVGLPLGGGTYAFTGATAAPGVTVPISGGSYIFSGTSAAFGIKLSFPLPSGSYLFTGASGGSAVTLTFTPAGSAALITQHSTPFGALANFGRMGA